MSTTDGEPTGEKADNDDDKVTLSSIHQAKGLEWKVVFLIWLVDGQFPNGRILEADDDAAFEEERRLFYVALTRAKDQLYLSYPMMNPKSYTGDILCRPSRFWTIFRNTSSRYGTSEMSGSMTILSDLRNNYIACGSKYGCSYRF